MMQIMQPPSNFRKHDLSVYTGWKIGNFFVTGRWKANEKCGDIYWEVQCSCGSKSTYKKPFDIVNQTYTSCGKCAPKRITRSGSEHASYRGTRDIPSTVLARIRCGCKTRSKDISCDLTLEDIQEVWDESGGVCAYTGWSIEILKTASIDRIDSSGNYTKSNIQFVHKDINRLKQDFSEDYFYTLCKAVTELRDTNAT